MLSFPFQLDLKIELCNDKKLTHTGIYMICEKNATRFKITITFNIYLEWNPEKWIVIAKTTLQIGNLEYKSELHDIQFVAEDEFLELRLKKNSINYFIIINNWKCV